MEQTTKFQMINNAKNSSYQTYGKLIFCSHFQEDAYGFSLFVHQSVLLLDFSVMHHFKSIVARLMKLYINQQLQLRSWVL